MAKLPFVVEPKAVEFVEVGTEETGKLKIKKIKDLSLNERQRIKELMKPYPNPQQEAVKISRTIGSALGKSPLEVFNKIVVGNIEEFGDYQSELVAFQDLLSEIAEARTRAMATAILQFRVDPTWQPEDTGNAELIHPALVRALAEFAANEENGWVSVQNTVESEEDLGKSSKTSKNPTGKRSSGESPDTGPMTLDLVTETLETSQSA